MKARFVKKLMAISLSLAMTATMVPTNAAAADIQRGTAAVTKITEIAGVAGIAGIAEKESETQKESETSASAKETKTYKTKVVLPGTTQKTKIKSLSVKQDGKDYKYDYKDLETTEKGELTLKLPANEKGKTTTVVANSVTFTGTVTDDDKAELKESKSTEKETEKSTEKVTEKETEKTTEKATEKETEKATEKETEKSTEKDDQKTKEDSKTGKAEGETEQEKESESETNADSQSEEGISADDLQLSNSSIEFSSEEYGYSTDAVRTLTVTNANKEKGTKITGVEIIGDTQNAFVLKTSAPTPEKPIDLPKDDEEKKNSYSISVDRATNLLPRDAAYKATLKITFDEAVTEDGKEVIKTGTKEVPLSFNVNKRSITLTLKPELATYPYNGKTQVTVVGTLESGRIINNDKLEYPSLIGTIANANVEEQAKTITLPNENLESRLAGEAKDKYQITSITKELTVTITKATLTPEIKSIKNRDYDGTRKVSGELSFSGAAEGETPTATADFEIPKKDAGTYKKITVKNIKLDEKFAGNYQLDKTELENVTYEKGVVISRANKAPKAIKKEDLESKYDTITIRNAVAGQKYRLGKNGKWRTPQNGVVRFTKSDDDIKEETTYTITVKVDDDNYVTKNEKDYKKITTETSRLPKTASTTSVSLTGITSGGTYKVSNRIDFKAKGADPSNVSNIAASYDDVIYLPDSWRVSMSSYSSSSYSGGWTTDSDTIEKDTFPVASGEEESASFTPTRSGSYTIRVTYKKMKYDGSKWVDQNSDYVKSVSFTVNSTGRSTTTSRTSSTSRNTSSNNKRTTAVKTGDTSPIIPLAIVLVACVAVFAGVGVVSAKKKKQNK